MTRDVWRGAAATAFRWIAGATLTLTLACVTGDDGECPDQRRVTTSLATTNIPSDGFDAVVPATTLHAGELIFSDGDARVALAFTDVGIRVPASDGCCRLVIPPPSGGDGHDAVLVFASDGSLALEMKRTSAPRDGFHITSEDAIYDVCGPKDFEQERHRVVFALDEEVAVTAGTRISGTLAGVDVVGAAASDTGPANGFFGPRE